MKSGKLFDTRTRERNMGGNVKFRPVGHGFQIDECCYEFVLKQLIENATNWFKNVGKISVEFNLKKSGTT